MKMIFQDAKDKYVTGLVAYTGADGGFFEDAELTKAVSNDDIKDAFLKNVLVIVDANGVYNRAVACSDTGVSIVTSSGLKEIAFAVAEG